LYKSIEFKVQNVKCREVDGNNCWGNTICVRNWITAIRIEGTLNLYGNNVFESINKITAIYGHNMYGGLVWESGTFFFDTLLYSNYGGINFPSMLPTLHIGEKETGKRHSTEFINIPVLFFGDIYINNSNVNFGMGLGTENNNKIAVIKVDNSDVKTAVLVLDGGYRFYIENNSSVDVRTTTYSGGGGGTGTYACIRGNSVLKLSNSNDPIGWDPYGFTCVSTTFSFETYDEIYCGTGNNPEKIKCSGRSRGLYSNNSYTNYQWKKYEQELIEEYACCKRGLCKLFGGKPDTCTRVIGYKDYSEQGARAVFDDYLKNYNGVWGTKSEGCESICGSVSN
jgi:hypothetical protein